VTLILDPTAEDTLILDPLVEEWLVLGVGEDVESPDIASLAGCVHVAATLLGRVEVVPSIAGCSRIEPTLAGRTEVTP
jgi:hypothetical protein